MLPLILFSDDTSGNVSKKWHKFNSFFLLIAGLLCHVNAQLEHIHFVSTSDKVSPLELSRPIVDELKVLEMEGVEAFDAYFSETVLVVAPLLCIICDNPRAAELLLIILVVLHTNTADFVW